MSFSEHFRPDGVPVPFGKSKVLAQLEPHSAGITAFMEQYAGCTFNGGLYRVHAVKAIAEYTDLALAMFPELKGRIACFASDWAGRQFAIDTKRVIDGERLVLLLDIGTGQAMEIPATFQQFHDHELVANPEDHLLVPVYRAWLESGGVAPKAEQCIGYKLPLFINGKDEFENMALSDMSVDWHMFGQILVKSRELPDGTPIGEFTIE